MISIENISLDYGSNSILNNISLLIKNTDRIGLIGNNGAGKTSFLRILSNQIEPTSGYINMKKNTKIGYLPQEVYNTPNVQLKSLVIGINDNLINIENRIMEINSNLEDINLSGIIQSKLLDELGILHDELDLAQMQNKEIVAEKILKGFFNSQAKN